MKRMLRWIAVAALGLAGAAHAQTLPLPAEFYFDEDRSALREIAPVKGEGNDLAARLQRTIDRNPNAYAERAQLARLAMRNGQVEQGRRLYMQAMQGLGEGNGYYRAVRWMAAWDLYRAGQTDEALRLWTSLVNQGGIKASWMPPTLAMALWSAGRKDDAAKWYAAAVRTHPEIYRDLARLETALPDWRPEERKVLEEVIAASP